MAVGAFYVATGGSHHAEAIASVMQLRSLMPYLPIAIIADSVMPASCFSLHIAAQSPVHNVSDKVTSMSRAPFSRTLFLDTGTYGCADVTELFRLLDRFDLAVAHASNRKSRASQYCSIYVPECFPEMNTGVLAFRRNARVMRFFAEWKRLFDEQCERRRAATAGEDVELRGLSDQPAFRAALYRSNLRVATLPPEYNFRFRYTAYAGTSVRILHGRDPELGRLATVINEFKGRRVFVPGVGVLTSSSQVRCGKPDSNGPGCRRVPRPRHVFVKMKI